MSRSRRRLRALSAAGALVFALAPRSVRAGPLTFDEVSAGAPPAFETGTMALGLTFGNGRFVVATSRTELVLSEDGRAWRRVALADAPWHGLSGVDFVNGRFFASFGFKVCSALDGEVWSCSPEAPASYDRFAFANGRYLAVGAYYTVGTSTDGSGWTAVQEPIVPPGGSGPLASYSIAALSTDGQRFFVSQQRGDGSYGYFSTVDGSGWAAVNPGTLAGAAVQGERGCMAWGAGEHLIGFDRCAYVAGEFWRWFGSSLESAPQAGDAFTAHALRPADPSSPVGSIVGVAAGNGVTVVAANRQIVGAGSYVGVLYFAASAATSTDGGGGAPADGGAGADGALEAGASDAGALVAGDAASAGPGSGCSCALDAPGEGAGVPLTLACAIALVCFGISRVALALGVVARVTGIRRR